MFQLQWFDENDSREFNINNIEPKPQDYVEVNRNYGMNHWKHIHPTKPHEWNLSKSDFDMLVSKATARLLTGRKFTDDDLDDFSSKLVKWLDETIALYHDGVFVKMTHKSPKNSFEGKLKPLTSAKEVLGRLTSTKDLFQHSDNDQQAIYISRWIDIDHQREYRVFYINKKLVAISQQDCYHQYRSENREQIVLSDAEKIKEYIINEFSKYDLYATATLDIAIINDGNDKVFLIECNPPSLHYASGSSLFYADDFDTFGKDDTIYVKIR